MKSYTANYLFTSERLGFRAWLTADIEFMVEINKDPEVMNYFPATQSRKQTIEFVEQMQKQLIEKGFCYFAVDKLENNEFIGLPSIQVMKKCEMKYVKDFIHPMLKDNEELRVCVLYEILSDDYT